jgi:hypothetical protein
MWIGVAPAFCSSVSGGACPTGAPTPAEASTDHLHRRRSTVEPIELLVERIRRLAFGRLADAEIARRIRDLFRSYDEAQQ